MAKTLDELTVEINAAVHTNELGRGKTTAPGLNAVLQSLAYELTAGGVGPAAPPAAATLNPDTPTAAASVGATLAGLRDEQYQQPFVLRLVSATTGAASLATLSLAQARPLLEGRRTSLAIPAVDAATGDTIALTVSYDAAQATFALSGQYSASGEALDPQQSRLIGTPAAPTFATLLGQPADNAALAALLAALPTATPQLALEFVFEAGFADSVGRTMGPRQAGTYASEQRQNVADVHYQLNGAPAALPLTVAGGDVLQVALTRQDTARPAVLTLLS